MNVSWSKICQYTQIDIHIIICSDLAPPDISNEVIIAIGYSFNSKISTYQLQTALP